MWNYKSEINQIWFENIDNNKKSIKQVVWCRKIHSTFGVEMSVLES